MRPAFIVVAHHSDEFRPDGDKYLYDYHYSLSTSMYPKLIHKDYDVFIIDNASTEPISVIPHEYERHHVYRLPDQDRGLVRAWNIGIQLALDNGNDFICITSDDLVFNDTIKNFFEEILKLPKELQDNAVFGTMCDAERTFPQQKSSQPINMVKDITEMSGIHVIHGWFMAFSPNYYHTYNVNGYLFDPKHKWRDQEQFQNRDQEKGARSIVIGHTLIHHKHIGGWGKVMEKEREQSKKVEN